MLIRSRTQLGWFAVRLLASIKFYGQAEFPGPNEALTNA